MQGVHVLSVRPQLVTVLPSLVDAPAWFDRWGLSADDHTALLLQLAEAWTAIRKPYHSVAFFVGVVLVDVH